MMRRAAAADYDSDDDFGDVSVGAGGRNPFFGGGAESNRAPISGLCFIPSFGGHSFVTSSFDGCVRIWDLRALTSGPTVTLRGSHDRLTRVDASSDIIAAGCMDGSVRMWDFRCVKADVLPSIWLLIVLLIVSTYHHCCRTPSLISFDCLLRMRAGPSAALTGAGLPFPAATATWQQCGTRPSRSINAPPPLLQRTRQRLRRRCLLARERCILR